MAANLLHSLADDNPDLQKQIGCMTGIFQVFDRQHLLLGNRPNQRRLVPPPSGNSKFSNGSLETDSNSYNGKAMDSISNRCTNETQRPSTESSTPSFTSSSRSSSFSSLDGGRTGQQETSTMDHVIFLGTSSRDPVISQTSASSRMGRLSVDLRNVIKDSMYRDSQGLSVKTKIKEDGSYHTFKHKDSPRPLQFSKAVNGLGGLGMTGKQDVPTNIKESLRILVNCHGAPWYYNEEEIPISSNELKDGSHFSMQRDWPRFSHDGKEIIGKIKDLPRLSLDSRESSARSSIVDGKFSHLSESKHRAGDYSDERVGDLVQLSSDQPRPSSVVAKLMGLDMFPAVRPSSEIPIEDHDPYMVPLRVPDVGKPVRVPQSPRRSRNEPTSPQCKSTDQVMKPTASSRFPTEPAPWKHLERCHSSPKQASSQAKRLLEAAKERSLSLKKMRDDDQRFVSDRNARMKSNYSRTSQASGSNLRRSSSSSGLESSIVIMKPAKPVRKSGIPSSSIIPVDGFPGLQRPQSVEFSSHRKNSAISKMTKDQPVRDDCRAQTSISADRRTNNRNLRAAQTSSRLLQVSKDNNINLLKNLGSISPRLQQKKLEFDNRCCAPKPPSDSNKTKWQPNWQSTDCGSPAGRRSSNTCSVRQNDEQVNEKSNCQEVSTSMQPATHLALKLTVDVEGASNGQSVEMASSQSPSLEAFECLLSGETKNDLNLTLGEEVAVGDLSIGPEQTSPVSVLTRLHIWKSRHLLRNKLPLPEKVKFLAPDKICNATTESLKNPQEDLWKTFDGLSTNNTVLELPSKISCKKLQSIDNLVQKLRLLNPTHNESQTDHIASLCESTNPNDRYISEILVTSGLLLRDLASGLAAFQLHPSGHPVNPELYFVLEQTKASLLAKGETNRDGMTSTMSNPEKLHRKLVFDVVNEILAGRLNLVGPPPEPSFKPDKLAKKTLSAQLLLKELCIEVKLLQAKKQGFSLEEEGDGLKNILTEEVMHRSDKWMDFKSDLSGIVLDVERSIFKELVNEMVISEAVALRGRRHR
ncbi:hypothetical protein Cgig2_030734 [Carnegiea gigantea]|uniref:DUF4378 domain-containing protein n=1 Tax=Carnegiea gigantea TaxID=171969 RepID=A0A9Q1KU05_9CARY|nr:hypothetical protein Cgig2_030734 [Carnegiea gigantea]